MTNEIRSFDYRAQYAALHDEIHAAIDRVLSSGQLILGPEVARFESGFTDYLGAGEGVGVASGTDAIMLGLRALGVGPGDEVVTVANTAVPTVSAIRALGALPVFCEVDPDTALIDLQRVEACLSARTRAVVPVHLYGNVVDVPRLREIVSPRGIVVLEDCAQAHGAEFDGRKVGTLGDAAAFSFYPTKNLGAFGDGGLCVSLDPEIAERVRSLREYGFDARRSAVREGFNSRLDELQAAILNVKLAHLPRFVERRRELAALYDRSLAPSRARPLHPAPGARHAYHLYVVRVEDRDGLRRNLDERGIATGVHYPEPIHLMPAYAFLQLAPGRLPVCESLSSQVLSLPLYPELDNEEVLRVAAAVADYMPLRK